MDNITKIIEWAEASLVSKGYVLKDSFADIQITPWSKVKRLFTAEGYIYLKEMPSTLSLEPVIVRILYEQFHANVPIIIDVNIELNCFIMKDSGKQLRELFKINFKSNLLIQAIKKYTYIQKGVADADQINTFLELGVPDWRLSQLPILYNQLINKEDLLKEDGMNTHELDRLHELAEEFSSWCQFLSYYKIPETIDHCDFHDGNILQQNNTNKITIIDWGETVITHPFFSLISCLNNVAHRYHLNENDKTYIKLQHTCFENWLATDIKNNLSEAILLTKKLQPVYRALGFYRLKMSCNAEKFRFWPEGQGCIMRPLRKFIAVADDMSGGKPMHEVRGL